jgi:hypothetical protein
MALVEHSIEIGAPVHDVYRISQDYSVRYAWDPFPESIQLVHGPSGEPQVGMQVLVKSKLGMSMLVEFVQVQAPSRAAVTMVSGPWYLSKFAGSWIFTESAPARTGVRFRYTITAKPRLLRFLLEPVAALYFSHVVKRRLAGLKAYCEGRV